MIKDSSKFSKIIRSSGEQNIICIDGGGLLKVWSLEIECCERRATVEVTKQHRVEDRGEDLVPFSSGVESRHIGCTIGVDSEDISTGDEGLARDVVCKESDKLTR